MKPKNVVDKAVQSALREADRRGTPTADDVNATLDKLYKKDGGKLDLNPEDFPLAIPSEE